MDNGKNLERPGEAGQEARAASPPHPLPPQPGAICPSSWELVCLLSWSVCHFLLRR